MNAPQPDALSVTVMEMDSGPGQHLRRAREEAALSIEEVAARLHLDTRTVGNLEADSYSDLPAPTFVRGYLRSYARLLELPAQPLIDSFDRRGLEPPPLVADITSSEEVKSTDVPMRLATGLIIVVLLAGVALWSQNQFSNRASGSDEESAGLAAGTSEIPQLRADTELQVKLPELRQSSSQTGSASGLVPVPTDDSSNPTSTSSDSGLGNLSSASGETTTETKPAAENADSATNLVSATPGVGRLVLRVRRDSWIEVYDREGERLYYSTARAGDSIDLRAAEPVKVLLGFARGVQVEYNGKSFDPGPHTARGLARFSLGG